MDRLHIFKIGGNIVDNESRLHSFLKDFSSLNESKILIHGGGKEATSVSNKLGIPVKLNNGRRITDAATLDIITMVYAGKINKRIVSKLQALSCDSIGICGADGNAYMSSKRTVEELDFGFVGDITHINKSFFKKLLKNNIIPVCCAVSHDGNGQLLNTNADTVASEIASALSENFEVDLTYCFEKKGVLENIGDLKSVIPIINTEKYEELKNKGLIQEGMLPKLHNCYQALSKGVKEIRIGSFNILSNNKHTKIVL